MSFTTGLPPYQIFNASIAILCSGRTALCIDKLLEGAMI